MFVPQLLHSVPWIAISALLPSAPPCECDSTSVPEDVKGLAAPAVVAAAAAAADEDEDEDEDDDDDGGLAIKNSASSIVSASSNTSGGYCNGNGGCSRYGSCLELKPDTNGNGRGMTTNKWYGL
jgi:hypothetical protein